MIPIFWYLLKVIICSGILFGYYWLFLRNKIFHRYNRFYLLAAMSLSMILPLLKINFWQPAIEQNQAIRVLRAVSVGDEYMNNIILTAQKSNWSWEQLYPAGYLLVSVILLFVMVRTLYSICTLLKKYPVQQIDEIAFVNTDDSSTPFSFFKYIFWNDGIDVNTTTGKQIFKHEVAHIQEKHTYDKLFINIVLVFCWCNPFFWLYRKELNMIHEFIADKKAMEDSDTSAFAAMILQAAYPKHRFELTNNFFYSPIKRRLLMLTKIDNPKISYIARLMVLPLAVLIFAAFTFKAKTKGHLYHGKKITVVIDAGHGGQDGGAKSVDGIFEKDLTLAIAKKIRELNSNENIEILLTRNDDIFQPAMQKAEMAKNQHADLFISIHIDKTPMPNSKTGINFFVARDQFENSGKSKILASALINEFAGNYPLPVFQSPVQRNAGVWVIQANNIPSVLIEAGFLSNEKDLAYLKTDEAKETIAKNVLAAIEKFTVSNLENNFIQDNIFNRDTMPYSIYINAKQAGKAYLESETYKTKALVVVDSKEIGNVGQNYVDSINAKYSTAVIYNPTEAKKKFGKKGRYGVIKLTQKDAILITSNTIFFHEKTKTIVLSGEKTKIAGDLSNALIYLENKIISPEDLNKIPPGKISSVSILKGEIDGIVDSKGKKSVIYISLKADVLPEVIIKSKLLPKEKADDQQKEEITISTTFTDKNDNNIFYIGLDNQLKVSSADINPGDLVVTISEGVSFSGSNGHYIVRAMTIGKKTLRLFHRNGTPIPGSFTINTHRVPDPADPDFPEQLRSKLKTTDQLPFIYIGPSAGGNIRTDYLKKQKIRLLAGYRLRSGKVWFLGPGFGNSIVQINLTENNLSDAEKYFSQCEDGAKIVFDNFSVIDENGVIHTVSPNPVFIAGLDYRSTDNDQAFVNSKDETPENANKIFTKVEQNPTFTGGEEAWRNYLVSNLKAVTPVNEGWSAGKYQVMVKFIIHTDGTVSDITTENYRGTKTAQHCMDVIKNAPKWQPALQNGRKVNAYHKQPITFVVKE